MQIGDIVYLYTMDLKSVLAVKQELMAYRFGSIIEAKPVKGGKQEQYMEYTVQSLTNASTKFIINNYMSPYKTCTLLELEEAIKELEPVLNQSKLEDINYLIKKIKEMTK